MQFCQENFLGKKKTHCGLCVGGERLSANFGSSEYYMILALVLYTFKSFKRCLILKLF